MTAATKPVRVIVGDDSGFIRILLSDYLRQDAEVDLVATASNGKEVVDKTLEYQPDVVITDLVMPEYDGLYAVKSIMNLRPIPIVLLSSLSRTDPKVFEALSAGAVEFLGKPQGQPAPKGVYATRLLDVVKTLGRNTLPEQSSKPIPPRPPMPSRQAVSHDILLIGASTGGPAVLETIITRMPAGFPVPIVIAQHMPPSFIESFAKRLGEKSALQVQIAEDGQEVKPGHVYLAGGEANLQLEAPSSRRGVVRFSYTQEAWLEFNNPSVDCLFESGAKAYGARAMAILLSGMGRDGAVGMKKIFDAGGYTMVQDEASSVVFGMGGRAVALEAVTKQVPAQALSSQILTHL